VKITDYISLKVLAIAGGTFAVMVIAGVIFFEPLTRTIIAQDAVCNYCHLPWEYNPTERLSATRPHGSKAEPLKTQPSCVECHLQEGWANTIYAYAHFVSFTDLFGHTRDLAAERAGDWIPPRAAEAYRVRDRLFEYDGNTCRTCHVEAEIKFTRKRGVKAHKLALKDNETCIECHNNLVHRPVEVREDAFNKAVVQKGNPS